jgi:hypothetical protein
MLEIFRCAITDEEMYALCRVLFDRASTGDMNALKMIFQYKMGKPQPAPNPDLLDRDEWDNLQKDGMTNEEMKQALTRLPSRVGNQIVNAALPEIIESFTRDLAGKLVASLPTDLRTQVEANRPATGPNGISPVQPADSAPRPNGTSPAQPVESAPRLNGFSPAQPAAHSLATDHSPLATTAPASRSTLHASRLPPVSNGNSRPKKGKKGKRRRALSRRQRAAG